MTDPQLIVLEEQVSHQQAVIDDLSDIVRKQGAEIELLSRRVALLMSRAAEAEADEGAGAVFADPPPPHY